MSSYRMRVLAAVTTSVVLLAVAWVWSLYGPLSSAVLERETGYLTGIARSAALGVESPDVSLQATVERLGAETGARITVVSSDGVVLADSDETPSALENHGGPTATRHPRHSRTTAAAPRSSEPWRVKRLQTSVSPIPRASTASTSRYRRSSTEGPPRCARRLR